MERSANKAVRGNQRNGNAQRVAVNPRLLRLRDAPAYLGMDRNRFNAEVRPYLTEIPLGTQGIAFDRLELDAWADDYIRRNGRPGRSRGQTTWDAGNRRAFSNEEAPDISTSTSKDMDAFAKALERATSRKRRDTSLDA